ncbi:neutral zinc metallopeptidase [Pedobacter sp. PAMC26386]|nr:neutral zinc metallopeptidase [Pedobacter sp. PAMC26386]
MKWFIGGSDNVEDARGGSKGKTLLGGGIGLIVVLVGLFFGTDLTGLVSQLPLGETGPVQVQQGANTDSELKFVSQVVKSTELVWDDQFRQMGKTYEHPKLTVFTESTPSACGLAESAVGPFYCPGDHKVYIDLGFYTELKDRFGAAGDFAQAYVVAHEVGHHVQNLLGISEKLERARGSLSKTEYNKLSVKLELQADFFAGLWANHAQKLKNFELDPGDLEEALTAANAIGDDRLQKQASGQVVPDAFTHGTSAQRVYWFKKGFDTGDINQGDTFNTNQL